MSEFPNWFEISVARSLFEEHAIVLAGTPGLRVLQIGAYTGDCSRWLLENVLTADDAMLVDVDTWEGSGDEEIHTTLDWDEVYARYREQVEPYSGKVWSFRGTSDDFFAAYEGDSFDLIYVDGAHTRDQVLADAENAAKVLRPGGLLVFDDYTWAHHEGDDDRPGPAIDEFMARHLGEFTTVHHGHQVWLQAVTPCEPVIAVYAIAKDEEQFVARWAASASDADYILLADTGSSDGTRTVAAAIPGVTVRRIHISPWRFDDARNAAMALLPDDVDYCVKLDLDEVLMPGWREELEAAWYAGVTRPTYRYVWSHGEDGSPAVQFMADHVHTRTGYRWRHPCHESLYAPPDEVRAPTGMVLEHWPDPTKSRAGYLDLLALAVKEDPTNDRMAHYYARELMHRGRAYDSVVEFRRHLDLPTAVWAPERAASMRYIAAQWPEWREHWLLKACAEAPQEREGWMALAEHYEQEGLPQVAHGAAVRALSITERSLHYISSPRAWDGSLEALAARCLAASTPSA